MYRILEKEMDGVKKYRVQRSYLFFFWSDVEQSSYAVDNDEFYAPHVWHEDKIYDTYEEAREVIIRVQLQSRQKWTPVAEFLSTGEEITYGIKPPSIRAPTKPPPSRK